MQDVLDATNHLVVRVKVGGGLGVRTAAASRSKWACASLCLKRTTWFNGGTRRAPGCALGIYPAYCTVVYAETLMRGVAGSIHRIFDNIQATPKGAFVALISWCCHVV